MALTIATDFRAVERISRSAGMISGTIDFDASYPTGGESATGITRYFRTCLRVICDGKSGYTFEWDKTNSKIKVMYVDKVTVTTGATAAADSVSGALITNNAAAETAFRAMGTAVSTDYILGTKDALGEVANTTDLSTLTGVSFIAVGLI